MPSRIKTSFKQEEPIPSNMPDDYQWLRENRVQLYEKHGECIVVIYRQAVIGMGKTHDEALTEAELHLADDVEMITPIVEGIGHPYQRFSGFFRRRPKQDEVVAKE